MSSSENQSQFGRQRDWWWQGWQVRYTYLRPTETNAANALPILLIHGFGSSLEQWRANLTILSQKHPIYALDMLGFGASQKAPANYKANLWAEQIYEFWKTFINQPVLLVGHSLGALVSLTTTTRYPEMVKGLVLLTLPATRQEQIPKSLQPMISAVEGIFANPLLINPIFQIARRPGVIRSALRLAYADPRFVTDDLVQSFVAPTGDRGAAQTLCRLTQAATKPGYAPDTHALLTKLDRPTILIWGNQDRVVPLPQRSDLIDHPYLQLIQVDQAGHCAYEEQAEQINHHILSLAAQCSAISSQ